MSSTAKSRWLAAAALVPTLALAGCSGSVTSGVSTSSTPTVAKAEVEKEARTELSSAVGGDVGPVTCPGDLEARVGAKMTCTISDATSGNVYDVTITVDSVDTAAGKVKFSAKIAPEPNP